MDTITATAQELAGEAYKAFERIERGDETITVLRDDRPEWVYEAVRAAHGDFMPDDWRYAAIRQAFGAIHDASEDADAQDVGAEYADGAIDTYTGDRLAWLASNLNRAGYCDEAAAEGLSDDADTVQRIGMGQYVEAREIWDAISGAIEELCEDMTDCPRCDGSCYVPWQEYDGGPADADDDDEMPCPRCEGHGVVLAIELDREQA